MQRIAPNNQYEAECFMEIFYDEDGFRFVDEKPLLFKEATPCYIKGRYIGTPAFAFKIRPNRIPTKHNFSK